MIDEVETEDAKLQKYILRKQEESLANLRKSDHDLKNKIDAITLKVAVIEKKQDIAQEDISKLSTDMDEIKSILDKASGSKETKDKIIKIAFSSFATFGAGDLVYHIFKNFSV
jgi:peptidoglycan hydrolase CwlO-like protein